MGFCAMPILFWGKENSVHFRVFRELLYLPLMLQPFSLRKIRRMSFWLLMHWRKNNNHTMAASPLEKYHCVARRNKEIFRYAIWFWYPFDIPWVGFLEFWQFCKNIEQKRWFPYRRLTQQDRRAGIFKSTAENWLRDFLMK